MKQFIQGTDEAWAALGDQARSACVRFRAEELPVAQGTGHIGFDATGARPLFLVEREHDYDGDDDALEVLFEAGELAFDDWDELSDWIRNGPIAAAMSEGSDEPPEPAVTSPQPEVVRRVKAQLADRQRGRLVDAADLNSALRRRVYGQDLALEALAVTVAAHVAKLAPRRPSTSLLVGPTGSGKTRTAQALAESLTHLSGQSWRTIRIDLGEYTQPHQVARLLGAPPGYIGHGQISPLDSLREEGPRAVIVFDELDKAAETVLLAVMAAMDQGEITTSQHTVDCRQTIFLFTANYNVDMGRLEEAAADTDAIDALVRGELAGKLRPELIGRLSRCVLFRELNLEARIQIAKSAIVEVGQEYAILVDTVAPDVLVEVLATAGSEDLGARPMVTAIERLMGNAFARYQRTGASEPVVVEGLPIALRPASQVAADEEPQLDKSDEASDDRHT